MATVETNINATRNQTMRPHVVISITAAMLGLVWLTQRLWADQAQAVNLLEAVRSHNYHRADEALRLGANVNHTFVLQFGGPRSPHHRVTALALAAYYDDLEMAKLLLRGGASPNLSEAGYLPVKLSGNNRNRPMYDLLVGAGADPLDGNKESNP